MLEFERGRRGGFFSTHTYSITLTLYGFPFGLVELVEVE
jgi:hypothetical protein